MKLNKIKSEIQNPNNVKLSENTTPSLRAKRSNPIITVGLLRRSPRRPPRNDSFRTASYVIILLIWILSFGFWIFAASPVFAASPPVRIKDITMICNARENQLMGFGLIVGLRHTGDSQQTEFTKQALTNLLSRMGLSAPSPVGVGASATSALSMATIPKSQDFKSKNVAAVMVTAILPPFIKQGQKIDVIVASLGDATSLKGGMLLTTPLKGPDENVYAVAQGPIFLGGISEINIPQFNTSVTTTGRIPGGAIVEQEVPVNYKKKMTEAETGPLTRASPFIGSAFTILLNEPDFTTASRVAYTIAKAGIAVRADDASSIVVYVPPGEDIISVISRIENMTVVPDVKAKIVVDERRGVVVIGENIRIAPVAVTYRHINVSVGNADVSSIGDRGLSVASAAKVKVGERGRELVRIGGGTSLRDLIKSLNAIGATPKDLIAILQAIKAAGALIADIEVM